MDSALLQAYANTDYLVFGEPLLCIRVGEPALELPLRFPNQSHYTIITAYNPRSQLTPVADNQQAHQRLRRVLDTLPSVQVCAPTVARDPTAQWPDEHGLLVANLSHQQVLELARTFRQHAVVRLNPPQFRAEILICHTR